jgi:hypothetical protein
MNKHFYNGPKVEIGKDFIKIKERNIKLSYQDIKLISIKNARVNRVWLLYIIAGIIGFSIILFLFCIVLQGLFSDSPKFAISGIFYRKRTIILFMLLFIGGPSFIIYKIKKYFKKYLMLIIQWDHHDFRIKISDLRINVNELRIFLESKTEFLEFDNPNVTGKNR